MQRRTACFPETPPESQRADDQSGSACYMRRWVTEKLAPHFGGKHLHLHQQRCPLQDTGCRSVTEIPRRLSTGCCSGEMSTAGVFLGGGSANICRDQAAPGLELVSLACFEPIAWRLCSSGFDGSLCYGNGSGAPKAHTARPQLCRSTLTSFIFCAKASFKTVNKTGPASAETNQNIALGFNLNVKCLGVSLYPNTRGQ